MRLRAEMNEIKITMPVRSENFEVIHKGYDDFEIRITVPVKSNTYLFDHILEKMDTGAVVDITFSD